MSPDERAGHLCRLLGDDEFRVVHGRQAIAAAVRNAAAAERARLAAALDARASQYEHDGEPGPLGLSCWGWRDIAAMLRREAERVRSQP